jgi:predicted permease
MKMNTIWQDIRYGMRRLRRSPGFATTAILTLALGIGATTAIFTLTYQVLLRSIPVQKPEELYKIGKEIECCVDGGLQNDWRIFSQDLYRTFRENTADVDGMLAVQAGSLALTSRRAGDNAAQSLDARAVSGNYFQVLGVQTLLGRLITPEDDKQGAPPVVVLSHAIWMAKFHADPTIVGHDLLLAGHPVTVIGVAAESFMGERNTADPAGVWFPIAQEPVLEPERKLAELPNSHWLDILVRIPDHTKVPAVEKSIQVELSRWLRSHREPSDHTTEAEFAKQTTELAPAASGINNLGDQYKTSLNMLMLISGFVLLITCANLANLMLVRGMARSQELSVRTALGAPRTRLIRQMLVEALLLSLIGGLLSLLVAYGGVKGMLALAMKDVQINPLHASPSLPVLLFALAISLLTGILFGIAPAWIATSANPAEALRGANRSTTDSSAGPQRVLVILQAALSVALLSTAGLLIASLRKLEHQDFRFEPKGRLVAFIDIQAAGIPFERLDGLYRRLEQAFEQVPSLHDFAYATYGPMNYNNWGSGVAFPGQDPSVRNDGASYSAVSPHFFDAVGTRVLLGRSFNEHDTATSTHVAIVNKRFVDKYLAGKQVIGSHFGTGSQMANEFEIVGVVDDSKYGDPKKTVRAMYFTPMVQMADYSGLNASPQMIQQNITSERSFHFASNLFVRYEGDASVAANTLRRTFQSVNSDIPISRLVTYTDQVSGYFTQDELVVRLTILFGVLALILASLGIYGVTAYTVNRRTSEIGIRMALGADRGSVLRMILGGAMRQTVIGLLIGIPFALAAGRLLQSQLYGVSGWSPLPLVASSILLFLSALLAGVVPARRASSIEPMQALRAE